MKTYNEYLEMVRDLRVIADGRQPWTTRGVLEAAQALEELATALNRIDKLRADNWHPERDRAVAQQYNESFDKGLG